MRRLLMPLMAVVLSAAPGNPCSPGTTDEQAREIAKDTVRRAIGPTAPRFLVARRREDLEDSFFASTKKVIGETVRPPYFYEVDQRGWEIAPNGVQLHTSVDGQSSWYVAIRRDTGRAYGLYGFPDPTSAFNTMVGEVPMVIADEAAAEAYALFAFQATYGPAANNVLYHPLGLRHGVEEYFYAYYPESAARKRADKWLKRFKSNNPATTQFAPSTELKDGGYIVRIRTLLRSQGESPKVLEWLVEVSSEGRCQIAEPRSLFE